MLLSNFKACTFLILVFTCLLPPPSLPQWDLAMLPRLGYNSQSPCLSLPNTVLWEHRHVPPCSSLYVLQPETMCPASLHLVIGWVTMPERNLKNFHNRNEHGQEKQEVIPLSEIVFWLLITKRLVRLHKWIRYYARGPVLLFRLS